MKDDGFGCFMAQSTTLVFVQPFNDSSNRTAQHFHFQNRQQRPETKTATCCHSSNAANSPPSSPMASEAFSKRKRTRDHQTSTEEAVSNSDSTRGTTTTTSSIFKPSTFFRRQKSTASVMATYKDELALLDDIPVQLDPMDCGYL